MLTDCKSARTGKAFKNFSIFQFFNFLIFNLFHAVNAEPLPSPLSSPSPTPINKGKVNVVHEVNIKTKTFFPFGAERFPTTQA